MKLMTLEPCPECDGGKRSSCPYCYVAPYWPYGYIPKVVEIEEIIDYLKAQEDREGETDDWPGSEELRKRLEDK